MAERLLVHSCPRCGKGVVEDVIQAAQQVIGVEHRILGHLLEPVGPVAEDIGERAGEHPHLAVKGGHAPEGLGVIRSEEHTSELQSLMRISYAVFCLKKKTNAKNIIAYTDQ